MHDADIKLPTKNSREKAGCLLKITMLEKTINNKEKKIKIKSGVENILI